MNLLILDGGHNEYVQGKKAPDNSLYEWQFNNDMQYKIKKRAEDHGIKVCLTNPEPSKKDEIGLSKRSEIANSFYKSNNKPNSLFISLHANAYGSVFNTARGTETYVASNASQNSKNAAQLINNSIFDTFKSIDSGAKNRGVKTEDFTVIYKTITPAILVEYGFYTNEDDIKILKNNKDELTEATVKGICKHFGIEYKAIENKPSTPNTENVFYRVVAGSYQSRDNANAQLRLLEEKGIKNCFIDIYKK